MGERKKYYGVIVHQKDFEDVLGMSAEEAGHILQNMIKTYLGSEDLVPFADRYLTRVSREMCDRVLWDKEASERAKRNGSKGGAPVGNTNNTTKSQPRVNQESTKSQPTDNQKSNYKSNSNSKSNIKNNITKDIYGVCQNVYLTDDEHKKIVEAGLTDLIDELSLYIDSKGVKYRSHYSTILSWARRKEKETKTKTYQFQQMSKTNYDMDALEKKLIKN